MIHITDIAKFNNIVFEKYITITPMIIPTAEDINLIAKSYTPPKRLPLLE